MAGVSVRLPCGNCGVEFRTCRESPRSQALPRQHAQFHFRHVQPTAILGREDTHIIELLRNGATLPEAQKLARHSDIKMTMRYAHIGLGDQAEAIAHLPADALQMRCISGGVRCHSVAIGRENTNA